MLMLGIVIVVLALSMVVPISQHITTIMGNNTDTQQGLNCSNATIDKYTKANCVVTDLTTPFFFYGLLAIATVVIGAKFIVGLGQ